MTGHVSIHQPEDPPPPQPKKLSFTKDRKKASNKVTTSDVTTVVSSDATNNRPLGWTTVSSGFSTTAARAVGTVSSNVLTAYLGFKDPKKRKREYLIPKDRAAWLEWMVMMSRRRINVEYLNEKELRKVIIRARPNLSPYKKPHGTGEDPDLPPCIAWNEAQVGEWIVSMGWPQLKETFVKNVVTGRKLVLIDCAALSKMGMSDLASMREVAKKIRDLLGIPPPNQLRPLMRISPYERFLRRKVYSGRTYDDVTFQRFCEAEGYNYELISKNKNMLIPCTAEITITTPDHEDVDEEGGAAGSDDQSLRNAPTVEFLVRNALIRNKTVDQIMDDILESVFLPPRDRRYGKDVWGQLKRGIGEGFDDLHLHYPKQRLDFAAGVAHSLIEELYNTVAVLNDINDLEKYIDENITEEDMDMFRSCAQTLMEEALPLVGLLAMGELDLETIFKQEPEFQIYVKAIVQEAEKRTNELVPDAAEFVDQVISEALKRVPTLDLSELNPETKKNLLKMTDNMANHLQVKNAASDAGSEAGHSSSLKKSHLRPGSMEPGHHLGHHHGNNLDPGHLRPGNLDPGHHRGGSMDPGHNRGSSMDPGHSRPGSMDPGHSRPGSADPGHHENKLHPVHEADHKQTSGPKHSEDPKHPDEHKHHEGNEPPQPQHNAADNQ